MIAGWRGWTAGLGRSGKRGDGPPPAGNRHGTVKQDALVALLVRQCHYALIPLPGAALTPFLAGARALRRCLSCRMMVATWTLVPPFGVTARARRACRDDDGRFVLRSVPPGLQERSAADVPAGSASHLAQRGEAVGETNAVRRHAARPRGTRRGADSGLAPRNRSASESRCGHGKPPSVERHKNGPRLAKGLGEAKRNSALVATLLAPNLRELAPRNQSSPLGCSPWKPARPIMSSTARSASSPFRRGAGAGDGDEKPLSARARSAEVVRHDDVVGVAVSRRAERQQCAAVCNGLGEASVYSSMGVELSGICGEAAKGEAAGFASGRAEAQATSRSR